MITRTVAATFRARDGARADTRALYRPDDPGWSGLGDVDFRVGRFGQLEFTHRARTMSSSTCRSACRRWWRRPS
jgi:hypothetical protein